MSESFKKCVFGGFDPQDVIAYIDRTAKENQAKIATLTEENELLNKRNQEIKSELNMIRQQFAEHENEVRTSEELRTHLDAAQEKLQKLETEVVALRAQSEDYQALKDHIADIEISAHRRSEEFRVATVAQLRELIDKQRIWYDEMKTKYLSITEQFSQKLQQAQQTLANPDLSGFSEMEESLRNLADTLSE